MKQTKFAIKLRFRNFFSFSLKNNIISLVSKETVFVAMNDVAIIPTDFQLRVTL